LTISIFCFYTQDAGNKYCNEKANNKYYEKGLEASLEKRLEEGSNDGPLLGFKAGIRNSSEYSFQDARTDGIKKGTDAIFLKM
jgi:hypothetical protein